MIRSGLEFSKTVRIFMENVTLKSSVKLSILLHQIRLNYRNWSVFRWKIVFSIVRNWIQYIAICERAMPAVLPVLFISNISIAWVAVWIKESQKKLLCGKSACNLNKTHSSLKCNLIFQISEKNFFHQRGRGWIAHTIITSLSDTQLS